MSSWVTTKRSFFNFLSGREKTTDIHRTVFVIAVSRSTRNGFWVWWYFIYVFLFDFDSIPFILYYSAPSLTKRDEWPTTCCLYISSVFFFSIVESFHVFFSFMKTTCRRLKKKNIGTFEVWYRTSEQLHVYNPRVLVWNGSCFYIRPKTVSNEKNSEKK